MEHEGQRISSVPSSVPSHHVQFEYKRSENGSGGVKNNEQQIHATLLNL